MTTQHTAHLVTARGAQTKGLVPPAVRDWPARALGIELARFARMRGIEPVRLTRESGTTAAAYEPALVLAWADYWRAQCGPR